MATNGGDRIIDENDGISDVLPRICGRKKDPRKRIGIVEKHNVRMVARYYPRRNLRRTTHDLGTIGKTIGDGIVYRIRSDVLLCLLLGLLLGSIGTNPRDWVSMATTRN
jgi:hypothetical protein